MFARPQKARLDVDPQIEPSNRKTRRWMWAIISGALLVVVIAGTAAFVTVAGIVSEAEDEYATEVENVETIGQQAGVPWNFVDGNATLTLSENDDLDTLMESLADHGWTTLNENSANDTWTASLEKDGGFTLDITVENNSLTATLDKIVFST